MSDRLWMLTPDYLPIEASKLWEEAPQAEAVINKQAERTPEKVKTIISPVFDQTKNQF